MDHICIESLKDYIRKISTASVANGLGWGHLHLILNKCQVPMFSQLVDQKTRRQKQLKDIILQLRSGIIYDQVNIEKTKISLKKFKMNETEFEILDFNF